MGKKNDHSFNILKESLKGPLAIINHKNELIFENSKYFSLRHKYLTASQEIFHEAISFFTNNPDPASKRSLNHALFGKIELIGNNLGQEIFCHFIDFSEKAFLHSSILLLNELKSDSYNEIKNEREKYFLDHLIHFNICKIGIWIDIPISEDSPDESKTLIPKTSVFFTDPNGEDYLHEKMNDDFLISEALMELIEQAEDKKRAILSNATVPFGPKLMIKNLLVLPIENATSKKSFVILGGRESAFSVDEVAQNSDIINLYHQMHANHTEANVEDFFVGDLQKNLPGTREGLDGVAILNEKIEFTYLNQKQLNLFGHTDSQDFIGRGWDSLYGLEGHDLLQKEIIPTLNQTGSWKGTTKSRNINGDLCYIDTQIIAVQNQRGEKIYFSISYDTTERKKVEQFAQDTLSRLQIVIGSIPSAILLEDEHGNIIVINDLFRSLFFIKEGIQNLVGKTSDKILSHITSDQTQLYTEMSELLNMRNIQVPILGMEIEIGDAFYRRNFIPVFFKGNLIGRFWQYTDITQVKKNEAELIAERKKAELANQAKSKFLSNMSHEIRTPLNSILGMADLLDTTSLTIGQREYLGLLKNNGQKLLNISNDILDISRIETGNFTINSEWFNLLDLLSQETHSWIFEANKKNIIFKCLFKFSPFTTLHTDPLRLSQVLMNLIGNSLKFTPAGGNISLEVTLNKEEIHFTVLDDGIGMSKEFLSKIFSPFTQEDSSPDKKMSGTGLGLSICKNIVNRLDGEITVTSDLNQGSRFSFYIKVPIQNLTETTFRESFSILNLYPNEIPEWSFELTPSLNHLRSIQDLSTPLKNPNAHILLFAPHATLDTDFIELIKRHLPTVDSLNKLIIIGSIKKSEFDQSEFKNLFQNYLMYPISPKILNDILFKSNDSKYNHPQQVPDGPKIKILLVDDVEENRFLIKQYLDLPNLEVVEAIQGKEALELFKKHSFDLILMDIQMPVMDGISAIKAIRDLESETPSKAPIKIVALTGNGLPTQISESMNAGANAHWIKPIKRDTLYKYLSEEFHVSNFDSKHGVALKPESTPFFVPPDEDLLELLPGYIDNRMTDIRNLQDDLVSKNFSHFKSLAHKIKGHALSYGLAYLGEIMNRYQTLDISRVSEVQIQEINLTLMDLLEKLRSLKTELTNKNQKAA